MSSNENTSTSETFEEALARLEALTARLEDPETGLEAAIGLYEKGTLLARECARRLQEAELRVEKLRSRLSEDPGGSPPNEESLFPDPG